MNEMRKYRQIERANIFSYIFKFCEDQVKIRARRVFGIRNFLRTIHVFVLDVGLYLSSVEFTCEKGCGPIEEYERLC